MTILAISIAVISGFKTAARPQKRSTSHFKAATAYHTLFENFRDFVTLDLADKSTGLNRMRERYEEFSDRRIELNEEMPDNSSLWYRWLSISNKIWGKSVYDEIRTSEQAKKQLTGKARFEPTEDDGVGDDVKDRLTVEADLDEESGEDKDREEDQE
jgi:hypothetical protein